MTTNGNGKHGNGKRVHHSLTPELKEQFLALYPEWGSIGATAKSLTPPVSRQTIFNGFKADEDFRTAYEALVKERRDDLISRIYRSATGRCAASHDEVGACITLLKATDHIRDEYESARFTEKYEVTGKDDAPLQSFVFIMPDGSRKTAGEVANGNGN